MIAITISGQSRSRSSPPLLSVWSSSIFRVNYSPEGAFLWSQVGGGANYHTFVNWKESNQAKRVSDEQCIMFYISYFASGYDFWCGSPEGTNFHNFWPNERDSPLRAFVGCKCKFCDNCSFLRPAPPSMVNQSQWENKPDNVKGLAEFHCEFVFSSRR